MIYVFAAISVIAITFLMWRAFGPQGDGASNYGHSRAGHTRGPVGPDDDQDFLRDLDNRTRGSNGSDSDDS